MADLIEFAEDATRLKWQYEERRDGEIARFSVCGLHAYVRDCDGDGSFWYVRKGYRGPALAKGERADINHFFGSLGDAEAALRRIIAERVAELRAARPSPTPPQRRRLEV